MSDKETCNKLMEQTNAGLMGLLGYTMEQVCEEDSARYFADMQSGRAELRFNATIDPAGITVYCYLEYRHGAKVPCFENRASYLAREGELH